MRINSRWIFPGTELEDGDLMINITSNLPDFGQNFIIESVSGEKPKADDSTSLIDIISCPYLFYSNFNENINTIRAAHNSAENRNLIQNKVNEKIKEIYKATEAELVKKDPLETIFILHLIEESRLDIFEIRKYFTRGDVSDSFANFKSMQSFQKLIYIIGGFMTKLVGRRFKSNITLFIDFITNRNQTDLNFKRKVVNFWLSKIIFSIPYNYISFVCYILFKENVMSYSNTWMLVYRSIIMKYLFCVSKFYGYEKVIRKTLDRSRAGFRFFGSYKKLYNDIKNSFLKFNASEKLENIAELDEQSAVKTYNFLIPIYQIIVTSIN